MSIRLTSSRHLVSIIAALALTACASTPGAEMSITSTATAPRGDVDGVQALLMQGDIKGGKNQLKSLLKVYPMDPRLMLLQQSISENPTELLGPTSYSYTVRSSDTMEGLAERLLGNKLKAYQLARYNRLKMPAVLVKGQILQIPGGRSVRESAPAVVRKAQPVRSPETSASPVSKEASAPPKPAAQPAAASRARSAGLAALNRGAVNEAIRQLQRAHSLDPDNEQIFSDLQRAKRIASTVRSRR